MLKKQVDNLLKQSIRVMKAEFLRMLNADAPDEKLIIIAHKLYIHKWLLNRSRTGQPDDAIPKEDVDRVKAVFVSLYEKEIALLYEDFLEQK